MEGIIIALITTVGGVMVAMIHHSRKKDSEEHGMVMETLTRVETKIDGHINDHAKGEFQEKIQLPIQKRRAKAR